MSLTAPPRSTGEDEVRRFKSLYHLLTAFSDASTLEDVYTAALKSVLEATSADRAAIAVGDDDEVFRLKSSQGLSVEYQALIKEQESWPWAIKDAQQSIVPDVLLDQSLSCQRNVFQREGIRGIAVVPLPANANVSGKFVLYYNEPHECTGGEIEVTKAIAAHVSLAVRHKRSELARARSEQLLDGVLDNSPAAIFFKDLRGRYLLVNRRCEQLFRMERAAILGRTAHEIFPAEVAERIEANDRAALEAGTPLTFQEYARQDNGHRTYLSTEFPLKDSDGNITGLCGIASDISDRREIETVSQHLAAIVESSEDAIIAKDSKGIITSWNKGAERIFGYTADEVIGRPVSILASSDRRDEMPEILSKILQGKRVDHYETRRRRKDGQIIEVALTVSPVRDAAGQIIGASKIARDISHRKLAEQERAILLAREQEARRTAELLNRVGPKLAAQLDQETLFQEVTDIATALVGAEFGAFFHNVVNEKGECYMLYTLSGVSREAFVGFPMPRNTEIFAPTFHGEGPVRCEDVTKDPRYGKSAPYHGMPKGHLPVRSYLAVPVIARSGEVLGGLFFGHSVPGKFIESHEVLLTGIAAQAAIAIDNARLFEQAHWAQNELKRSNEELRRANRDLEVFAYSASHDLQEPLRTIAISAQLIERNWGRQLSGNDAIFLTNILTAAKRMSGLIEDLHSYARATQYEEGQAHGVDPGRVVADVLAALRAQIEDTRASVAVGELPLVAIHETRLAQVFQNLIGNALKYRSEETPRVSVSAIERDGWCIFSVIDNGIGIEPQYAERIFGLFKRLHGRDEYPGSGIGLAICQRVVEQYGGRIWLEHSSPGRGSTFCFSVPLCPSSQR